MPFSTRRKAWAQFAAVITFFAVFSVELFFSIGVPGHSAVRIDSGSMSSGGSAALAASLVLMSATAGWVASRVYRSIKYDQATRSEVTLQH